MPDVLTWMLALANLSVSVSLAMQPVHDWPQLLFGCFVLGAPRRGQSKEVCAVCKAEPLCVFITGRLILPKDAREQGQRERVDALKTFVSG